MVFYIKLARGSFIENSTFLEEKMKRFIGILFGLALFVSAGIAFAQGDVKYAEKTEYSFDDDVVTGDLVRPDGELTIVRKKGKERSLIRVRQHFIPEMLKSVENL